MGRRQRIDSATAAVRIMQGATRQIQPPSHVPLDECDWPFFESVIEEFARADWTEHQIELATMLAKDMADAERNRRLVREEGEVLFTEGAGNPKANPRCNVLVAIGNRILATRRSLSLHARARQGEARDVAKRQSIAKGIEADLGDELIARPVMQ